MLNCATPIILNSATHFLNLKVDRFKVITYLNLNCKGVHAHTSFTTTNTRTLENVSGAPLVRLGTALERRLPLLCQTHIS